MGRLDRDKGYSVNQALDGLYAAQALVAGAPSGRRRSWIARESWWQEQLRYAQQRERDSGPQD